MPEKITNITALILLFIMFLSGFFSYQGDSATMDELSHIPAGYSYVSQKDFRINPEHPPLIKSLAGLPLLFLNLNFPSDSWAWNNEVNAQWNFGYDFLYASGNNVEQILFWARLPMLFLLVFLGWFIFYWTKKEFGKNIALFVLTLFSFSPTFLAHGRLVTTDIGAVLGFILGFYFWLKFLRNPSKTNVIATGFVFGICMLFKFSLALLIPSFAIITLTYALLNKKNLLKYILLSILIGVIGTMFVILPVYQIHVLNYPPEKQLSDTMTLFPVSGIPKKIITFMAGNPATRALAHYFLGLMMATHRTATGNTVYFFNRISNSGWWYYFPAVYLLKIPLAFHILTLLSLSLITKTKKEERIKDWIKNHFTEFSMLVFLAIYWGTSMVGILNLGIRHILPVFPFTYILVGLGLSKIKEMKKPAFRKTGICLIVLLLGWYIFSSLNVYPHYLSYFNEIVSGTDNGYKYITDSNYDWGQDLKRLTMWVEENNIEKIKIDYFGGGNVKYYLGNRSERLNALEGPQKGWLAISANSLQMGKGELVPGFEQDSGYYRWLDEYEPITRAGKSIFIYHIED